MASSSWLHYRLRLCRSERGGNDVFLLASVEAEVV